MTGLPRVTVLNTGGTIDQLGEDRLDLTRYVEGGGRLPAGELLRRVPEVHELADVHDVPFARWDSSDITPEQWLDLGRATHDHLDDSAGVVVTHGTNTLEETAYFLHLTMRVDRPVVLTGAMRPASAVGSDGTLNLINAVRVAASPRAAGQGVLVVVNDTIYSARDVTKTSTYRLQAFQAPDTGPLGYADSDGTIVLYHSPARRHTVATPFDVRGLSELPAVEIVLSYAGASPVVVDALTEAAVRGIVVAGSGSGRPTSAQATALAHARKRGVVVCHASRVGSGRVVPSPARSDAGTVAAGNLPPWKARVLLSLALTRTDDPHEIQAIFDEH